MSLYVVFTVDYELFGDASGDVRRHIIKPAGDLQFLGNRHGVPFTFFIEVEEYIAFCKYAEALRRDLGYDPAEEIRSQIPSMIRDGHDIQLHLHPQWINAEYLNGAWLLDHGKSHVGAIFDTQQETDEYIATRKKKLEELAGGNTYTADGMRAYRAGGFCARPSLKLLRALLNNNIIVDSSVVRGLYWPVQPYAVDFRDVYNVKRYWEVGDDVGVETEGGGFYEVPIHSRMVRRYRQISPVRLRAKFSKNVPSDRRREIVRDFSSGRGPFGILKTLFERVPLKLDFNNLSPGTLIYWLKCEKRLASADTFNVLVLIGHTKESFNIAGIDEMLGYIASDDEIEGITMSDLCRMLERGVQ